MLAPILDSTHYRNLWTSPTLLMEYMDDIAVYQPESRVSSKTALCDQAYPIAASTEVAGSRAFADLTSFFAVESSLV